MPLFLNEERELLNLRTFAPVRTKITASLMTSSLSCTRASRASFASLAASRVDDEAIWVSQHAPRALRLRRKFRFPMVRSRASLGARVPPLPPVATTTRRLSAMALVSVAVTSSLALVLSSRSHRLAVRTPSEARLCLPVMCAADASAPDASLMAGIQAFIASDEMQLALTTRQEWATEEENSEDDGEDAVESGGEDNAVDSPSSLPSNTGFMAGIQAFIASDEIQLALTTRQEWEDEDEDEGEDEDGFIDWGGAVADAGLAARLEEVEELTFPAKARREQAFLGRGTPLPLLREPQTAAAAAAAVGAGGPGVVRLSGALSERTAAALREEILAELAEARRAQADGTPGGGAPGGGAPEGGLATGARLSKVLAPALGSPAGAGPLGYACPVAADARWDLRLSLSRTVRAALRELLGGDAPLGEALDLLAGGRGAELWELAALISKPGAGAQIAHA